MNRDELLRISGIYDEYYPDNITRVNRIDKSYDKDSDIILKIFNTNIVNFDGKYLFKNDFSLIITKSLKFKKSDELIEILKALAHPNVKIRGAIYYLGKNIANIRKGKMYNDFFKEFLPMLVDSNTLDRILEYRNKDINTPKLDFKSKMPLEWHNDKDILLSVVDANIHFKIGRKIIKACNNLNFDIYRGEVFGLVGESGSGKTTISRAILGINKLTSGGIYFNGKFISKKANRLEEKENKRKIQMIFQDPSTSLNERANIDYIVSEGLYNFKLYNSKEDRISKVTAMLNNVGLLPEHLSRYPHEFSGGQRQRIGIARALIVEPELVLADEPISALDVSIRAQILNLLKKLQREKNLTYLFIAHDLSIIRYISDRIAVMHQGYIVELGYAEDIYNNPVHPYTKALLAAIPMPDPMNKSLVNRSIYKEENTDYSKWKWIEVEQKHYALIKEDENEYN